MLVNITKTYTQTSQITIEVVDIPGYPDFKVVYRQWSTSKNIDRIIARADKANKIKSLKNAIAIKPAEAPIQHQIAARGSRYHDKAYESGLVWALSPEALEAYKTNEQRFTKAFPEWKVVWGETIPEGWTLVALSRADSVYVDAITGLAIQRPARDFYLSKNYAVHQIVADYVAGKVPDMKPIAHRHSDSRYVYYVPGNGDSLDLDITVPAERYQEFLSLDMWGKKQFLDDNTSLGKYKRAEPLRDEEDDDRGY